MAANYNNSAWFYDSLSRLVYGKALVKAQVYLLQFIPANANVLIIGGGTGWILEELTKIHPGGLAVTYVEIAPKMMSKSQKRNTGNNQVTFINDGIENINLHDGFDVVVTPFLFDNFTEQTLDNIFNHIRHALKPGGLWLNCDFHVEGKWWQKALLKSMFLFFRAICNIEASELPDIERQFLKAGFNIYNQKDFFNGFIFSAVYVRG